jgi:membrane associated rhomboid family serine protease
MRTPPPPRRRNWRPTDFGASALNPALVLVVINLVFYIATLVATQGKYPFGEHAYINADKISYYMALIPYYFTSRPWMLISAMFIHAGFWHLFGNMVILYFFGTFLVRLIGSNWFLLVFFIGGLAGNALYLWLGTPLSLAMGASGAVYAITAALVVMVPNLRIALWGIVPMPLWVFVVVFLVLFSLPSYIGTSDIAWQAHLGGLVVGLIAGFYFRRRIRLDFYR